MIRVQLLGTVVVALSRGCLGSLLIYQFFSRRCHCNNALHTPHIISLGNFSAMLFGDYSLNTGYVSRPDGGYWF